MEGLRSHFISNVRKGILLTNPQLISAARKRKITPFSASQAAKLRASWLPTAVRRSSRKVKTYQTTLPKLGDVQIDFAFFKEQHRRFNKGARGFLACVETATYRIAILPFNDRTLKSYERAVVELVEGGHFSSLTNLYSDREAAVFSQRFQDSIKAKYGVRVRYLSRGSKAFLAEGVIRQISTFYRSRQINCEYAVDSDSDNVSLTVLSAQNLTLDICNMLKQWAFLTM